MDSTSSASRPSSYFLRISPGRAISIPYSSDSFLQPSNLPHPRLLHSFQIVLSLYAFTIHHHYPRILHFTHSPQSPHATRSTDSSHHLVTHRIRSYFILSTYTTLPTLLVVDYVGALRGGFHFFWYSFADRTNLVFSQISFAHCLIISISSCCSNLVSYLQLFCVFTIIIPQSLKGFQFLVPKSVSHLIIQVR